MRHKQPRHGFELWSSYPLPTKITVLPRAPPKHFFVAENMLYAWVLIANRRIREERYKRKTHIKPPEKLNSWEAQPVNKFFCSSQNRHFSYLWMVRSHFVHTTLVSSTPVTKTEGEAWKLSSYIWNQRTLNPNWHHPGCRRKHWNTRSSLLTPSSPSKQVFSILADGSNISCFKESTERDDELC